MRKILFPGSFDPFTIGHAALVRRALNLFDEVIIAVGVNEQKSAFIAPKDRVEAIRSVYEGDARVKVISYSGLTADLAQQFGVCAILRGVRQVKDYESELTLADVNRRLTGIDTVILTAEPEYAAISSSMVRELAHFGKNISAFLP